MNRPLCFGLPVWLSLVSPGFGQTAPPAPPSAAPAVTAAPAKVEMPTDPAALLALAAKRNGLQNVVGSPWHLKATYEVLNDDGAVKERGVFEEFWVADGYFERTYTGRSFTQTDYSTASGLLRSGNLRWPPEEGSMVQTALFPSIPSQDITARTKITLDEKKVGSTVLKCVSLDTSSPGFPKQNSIYCLGKDLPVLRLSLTTSEVYETTYNGFVSIGDVLIAKEIEVKRVGKPWLTVHIEKLERGSNFDLALMPPPKDAVPVTERIVQTPKQMGERIIHRVSPNYPLAARRSGIQGTVVLRVAVGIDGRVLSAMAIAGPAELFQPSEECIRQWLYSVPQVNAKPVEVETIVVIGYSLGH